MRHVRRVPRPAKRLLARSTSCSTTIHSPPFVVLAQNAHYKRGGRERRRVIGATRNRSARVPKCSSLALAELRAVPAARVACCAVLCGFQIFLEWEVKAGHVPTDAY
jgi:hypothetical protein